MDLKWEDRWAKHVEYYSLHYCQKFQFFSFPQGSTLINYWLLYPITLSPLSFLDHQFLPVSFIFHDPLPFWFTIWKYLMKRYNNPLKWFCISSRRIFSNSIYRIRLRQNVALSELISVFSLNKFKKIRTKHFIFKLISLAIAGGITESYWISAITRNVIALQ